MTNGSERDLARWVLCTSQAKADALQSAFLSLAYADPPVTKWLPEYHKDGADEVRVAIKTDSKCWIREDAPLDGFDALLQPYIDQGVMPQQDLDTIHDRIRLFQGTGVGLRVYNMLPKIIRDLAWTYDQMVENGWISED